MTFANTDATRLRLACTVLFLGTLLLFSRAISCDFLDFDDPDFLTQNPRVQAGLNRQSIREAFTSVDAANWNPLTRLSHVAAWQVFGADPRGHHAINVLVHALSAVLAFLALRQLTGAFWTSALSAALFAWHPLRVESVAWIAERKDVLSVFFGLLSLWSYAVYAVKTQTDAPASRRWYGLALVSFATGLLCKPMLVTLPFVLLLLDLWPLGRIKYSDTAWWLRRASTLVIEKAPFFLLSAGACIVTYLVQKNGGGVTEVFSLETRLSNAAVSIVRYLGNFFWPCNLAVADAHPAHWPVSATLSSSLVLLIISGISIQQCRARPWLLTGWLWFVGMLIPVVGIIQAGLQSMADRYTYLPVLGLQFALLWTLRDFVNRTHLTRLAVGAAVVALLLLGCLTWRQIGFWTSSRALFEHTLNVSEANPLAHCYLGTTLANRGQTEPALRHYNRALELDPNYAAAHFGLGVCLERKGEVADALVHYQQAVQLKPNYPQAQFGFGLALLKQNRLAEASDHFQSAISYDSNFAPAWRGLGLIAARNHQSQKAFQYFNKALEIDPRLSEAQRDWARALAAIDDHASACLHFQLALRLKPSDANTHYELGLSLEALNRVDAAASCYEQAVKLQPTFAEAHYNLGVILINRGQVSAAVDHFQAAATSQPDFGPAYFGLGIAASQSGRLDEAVKHWERARTLDPTIPGLADALADAHRQTIEAKTATSP